MQISVVPSQHYRLTYSDEAFASLRRQFSISDHIEADFRKQMENAAAIWRSYNAGVSDLTKPSTDRKALENLATIAERLHTAFTDLPQSARNSLETAYSNSEREGLFVDDIPDNKEYPIIRFPERDGTEGTLTISTDETLALLGALKQASITASQNQRTAQVGKKRDHALRMWIINIANIWEDILDRPFTRDATSDGVPISEAARFCVSSFVFLDSKTLPSLILNEMKLYIQGQNKKKKLLEEISIKNPPKSSSE